MNRRVRLQPLRVAVYLPVRDRGGAASFTARAFALGSSTTIEDRRCCCERRRLRGPSRNRPPRASARAPRGVVVRRNVPHRDVTRGTVDEESADDGEVRAGDGGVDVGGGHVPGAASTPAPGAGRNDGRRTVRRTLTMGAGGGRIEGRVAPAGIASRAFVQNCGDNGAVGFVRGRTSREDGYGGQRHREGARHHRRGRLRRPGAIALASQTPGRSTPGGRREWKGGVRPDELTREFWSFVNKIMPWCLRAAGWRPAVSLFLLRAEARMLGALPLQPRPQALAGIPRRPSRSPWAGVRHRRRERSVVASRADVNLGEILIRKAIRVRSNGRLPLPRAALAAVKLERLQTEHVRGLQPVRDAELAPGAHAVHQPLEHAKLTPRAAALHDDSKRAVARHGKRRERAPAPAQPPPLRDRLRRRFRRLAVVAQRRVALPKRALIPAARRQRRRRRRRAGPRRRDRLAVGREVHRVVLRQVMRGDGPDAGHGSGRAGHRRRGDARCAPLRRAFQRACSRRRARSRRGPGLDPRELTPSHASQNQSSRARDSNPRRRGPARRRGGVG